MSPAARRVLRVLLAIAIPVVVLVIVVLVLMATPWGNEQVRRFAVKQGKARITGDLAVESLRGNLFRNATLANVRIVDSAKRPVFTAKRVKVSYGLWSAIHGKIVIKSAVIDTAELVLDKRPGQRWNFQELLRPSGPRDTLQKRARPELANITAHNLRFVYRRPWIPDSTLRPVEREKAIAKALAPDARRRTERVGSGYQRVLEYRNIDAYLPTVQIGEGKSPLIVEIAKLSMMAEPYRPPAIDIRSLVGTLYATSDSLWWHGARMRLPGSDVSGDGKIGFHRSGFLLDLSGAPLALADLRWLDPKIPSEGGGKVRYKMFLHGDSSEFIVAGADIRYQAAALKGDASILRIKHGDEPAATILKGADLTVSEVSTALVRQFMPTAKIRRDGTLSGHVAARSAGTGVDLDANLRFVDAAGTSHVIARGDLGFSNGLRSNGLHVQVTPMQLATVRGFGVKLPLDGVLTGDAQLSGASKSMWSVSGSLTHFDRGETSTVSGSGEYRVADKHVNADVTLKPLSLRTVGRFSPKAELRGSVTGQLHAEGTARDLAISGTVHSATGGSVDGRGTLRLAGPRTRYDVAVHADALNTNALSGRAPRTLLTGSIQARGVGTMPATMNASFAADLVRSRFDTFAVDRLLARVQLANGLARVDTFAVFERGARAYASGAFGLRAGTNGTLDFLVVTDSLGALRPWIGTHDTALVYAAGARQTQRLAAARADSVRRAEQVRIERLALGLPEGVALAPDTVPPIRRDSLSGTLRADGQVNGNIKAFSVRAQVDGAHLVARGMSAAQLHATVASGTGLPGDKVPVDFNVLVDSVQAAGRAFERVSARGSWADRRLSASVNVRQDARTSYAAVGSYTHPDSDTHAVALDSLTLRTDSLSWMLAHKSRVSISPARVDVDSFDFRSSTGARLFANGTVPKAGGIRLDVAVENVRVATVLDALQQDRDADAVLNFGAQITGTRAAPLISSNATVRDGRWKETRTPDLDITARYAGQRISVDATARDTTGRRVFVSMASLPFDLALEPVKGSRKVAGALRADVVFDTLQIATLPITTRAVENLRGVVTADAHARGSWEHVDVTGAAQLRDAGFRMPLATTGMQVDRGVADLRFVHDTLFLDSLTALSRGPMRASGSVSFAEWKRPIINLVATAENVRVFDSPRGLVDANARVVALGPIDSLRVTGRGEMLGGYLALKQFRKDLLRVKAPGDLSFFAVYDTASTAADLRREADAKAQPKPRFAVVADLSLDIDRGNYYRNRPDANLEFYTAGSDEVRAHLDTRASEEWAVGYVHIGRGITVFRTRAFIPLRGTMTFAPHTGAAAETQEVSERVVWEPGRGLFPLQLLTGGTSTAPSVGLESGTLFPMRGRELNSYLTLGRLNLNLLQQSGSSLSGSEAWSGQLSGESGALSRRQQGATALGVVLHDIGTGATKEWRLDAFSVSPADLPTELVFGKTGGVRGAQIEGGKYVNTELYVAGQLHFTRGIPGVRVSKLFGTEYRLDAGIEPRFLFRDIPELGITHPTVRSGAFGAYVTRLWGY